MRSGVFSYIHIAPFVHHRFCFVASASVLLLRHPLGILLRSFFPVHSFEELSSKQQQTRRSAFLHFFSDDIDEDN